MNKLKLKCLAATAAAAVAFCSNAGTWKYSAADDPDNVDGYAYISDGNWKWKVQAWNETTFTVKTGSNGYVAGSGTLDFEQIEADLGRTWTLQGSQFRGMGNNNLTKVIFSENMTTIPDWCFGWMGSGNACPIESFVAKGKLTRIGSCAFYCNSDCPLSEFDADLSELTTIDSAAFPRCKALTGEWYLPKLTTVGANSPTTTLNLGLSRFEAPILEDFSAGMSGNNATLVLPNATKVGDLRNGITTVILSDKCEELGTFQQNSTISSVTPFLPPKVGAIKAMMFYLTPLKGEIEVGLRAETISFGNGGGHFGGNTAFTGIAFGAGLSEIPYEIFMNGGRSLKTVKFTSFVNISHASAFPTTTKQLVFALPARNQGWEDYLKTAAAEKTPLTAAEINDFTTKFGFAPPEDAFTFKPSETYVTQQYGYFYNCGRELSVSGYSIGESEAKVSVTLTGCYASGSGVVKLLYGPTDGGRDPAAWAHMTEGVPVTDAATTVSFTVTEGLSDLDQISAVYIPDNATPSDFAPAIHPDLDALLVSVIDEVADGDALIVHGTIVSAGRGDLTMKIVTSTTYDFAEATTTTLQGPFGVGEFYVTNTIPANATTFYKLLAETTEGGSCETTARSVTTKGASAIGVASATVSHHTVTYSCSGLTTVGAGESYALLYVSADGGETYEQVAGVQRTDLSPFSVTIAYKTVEPTTYSYYWTVSNSVPATGTHWTSSTATGSVTSVDDVVYTWKGAASGAWNDVASWSFSHDADDCLGHPGVGSTVVFPENTTATITLAGNCVFGTCALAGTGRNLTFVGDGAAATTLTGDFDGGEVVDTTLVFSRMTLIEKDGLPFGITRTGSRDSVLKFTDGAVCQTNPGIGVWASRGWSVNGDNVKMVVEKDAHFDMSNYASGFYGLSATLAVNDAKMSAYTFFFGMTDGVAATASDGGTIRFEGAHPQLLLAPLMGPRTSPQSWDGLNWWFDYSTMNKLVFAPSADLPKTGYEVPPLYNESTGAMPLGTVLKGSHRIVVSFDKGCGLGKVGGGATMQLIGWKSGIDTDNFDLVVGKEKAKYRWTYGWPSTLAEPENAGDKPTGLWADISGHGIIVILR